MEIVMAVATSLDAGSNPRPGLIRAPEACLVPPIARPVLEWTPEIERETAAIYARIAAQVL